MSKDTHAAGLFSKEARSARFLFPSPVVSGAVRRDDKRLEDGLRRAVCSLQGAIDCSASRESS